FLGATFPFACGIACRRGGEFGEVVSRLSAFNTLGAVAGALVAPAVVSGWGIGEGLDVAAGTLAVLALSAAVAQSRGGAGAVETPARVAVESREPAIPARLRAAVGLAGAATISLEILASRLLAFDLGGFSATYASVLAVFLAGIALGALVSLKPRAARTD